MNTEDLIFIQATRVIKSNIYYYTSLEPFRSYADSVAFLSSQAAGLLLCGRLSPQRCAVSLYMIHAVI